MRWPTVDERPLRLDGAMGTELRARGLPANVLPEQWVLERPDEVMAVHRAYVAAGADTVLTCTLNAHPAVLRAHGLGGFAGEIRRVAADLARRSGARKVLGVVGPLRPGTAPGYVAALCEAAAQDLASAGVDALVAETIVDLEEGVARVRGIAACGLPLCASLVPGLPAAERPQEAREALVRAGAGLIGINCADPAECAPLLAAWRGHGRHGTWLKPSAGNGDIVNPELWARQVGELLEGVVAVGGCCGAGPAHLAALSGRIPSRN